MTWNTFSSDAHLTEEQSQEIIDILTNTAEAYKRDFQNPENPVDKTTFMNLVNNTYGSGNDPKRNWIKVLCRFTDTVPDSIDVVIVFHLLKHTGLDANSRMDWSVSVGFKEDLLDDPAVSPGVPNDPGNEYCKLAREICEKIVLFGARQDPSINSFMWIDEDDADPKAPESEVGRRAKRIGELIWVAEHDHDVRGLFPTWSKTRRQIPEDPKTHAKMPGYGKDSNAKYMYVTRVSK